MERQDGSDGLPMGRRERHKKISLDSGSEESGEEGSRAVCRKEYSGKSDKEVEGTSFRKGLPSAPGGAGESASVDAINRRRTHGVEMWHTKWRRHGHRELERKV